MRVYLDLVRDILENGERRSNRTGVDTLSLFGYQYRVDLAAGFPLLTTKKVFWRGILHELLWFLRGDSNISYLHEHGVRIWDDWADESGDVGPIYGVQWRRWPGYDGETIDQLAHVLERLKREPDSRRMVVSAWNVGQIDRGVVRADSSMDEAEYEAYQKRVRGHLPPCHVLFQFHVSGDGRLSCQLYQRSADLFLGVPFNLASYALLTHIMAHEAGLRVGHFIHSFGDVHIYVNHIEQLEVQLSREPRRLPRLEIIGSPRGLDGYSEEAFRLEGYDPWPVLKGAAAV